MILTFEITWFKSRGSYQVIFEYPAVKIKILNVNPQSSLSLQSHEKRDEYWQIISVKQVS